MSRGVFPTLRKPVKNPSKRAQYIIHPTRHRSEVRWAGEVDLNQANQHARMTVYFGTSDPNTQVFESRRIKLDFLWKDNHFVFEKMDRGQELFDANRDDIPLQAVLDVVQKGIEMKQLKFHRKGHTTLEFNTWNENPSFVEFYDLREIRDTRKEK